MKKFSLLLAVAVSISTISCKTENKEQVADQNVAETTSTHKIVSLGGAITETIAALGHGNEIVGRDVTSTYPAELTAQDLGHVGRDMTIEGLMAVNPNLVLVPQKEEGAEVIAKIKESGIRTEVIPEEYSVEGAKNLIKKVAEIIGSNDYQKLYDKIDADLAQVQPLEKHPKVLFIYARGPMLMVSGTKTPMDAIIGLAGGVNAVTGFEDFKPLTPESLIQANPDVILMFDKGLQSASGIEAVLKVPGVSQTQAGKNKKIISLDGGLLTNFGPRTGEAAWALNKLLIEATK